MAAHLNRILYLNGAFTPGAEAKISIFDRGLLFSDAVYEGLGILDGRVVDFEMHMARLERSLGEIGMTPPMDRAALGEVCARLIRENEVAQGFLYLHITRGEADRDYVHGPGLTANVFAFVQPYAGRNPDRVPEGVSLNSHPDLRWKRRDIKTSNLLGQVIAKQAAHEAGAYEALLVDEEGFVTEGGATSFFIVAGGAILLRPVTNDILHGITRQAMVEVAKREGLALETRKFTLDEAYAAEEAFLTGAATFIEPVVRIDGRAIGTGEPGPIALKLRAEYLARARRA